MLRKIKGAAFLENDFAKKLTQILYILGRIGYKFKKYRYHTGEWTIFRNHSRQFEGFLADLSNKVLRNAEVLIITSKHYQKS